MRNFNQKLGQFISWATLWMTALTFLIVILRYFFQVGWVWMQELTLVMHSAVFLLAAGWAYQKESHVRIDIFYSKFSKRKKAWVNLLGVLFFLWPMCGLIFFQTLPYVTSSWKVLEGSPDSGGLPGIFLVKTLILFYALTLALQGAITLVDSKKEICHE